MNQDIKLAWVAALRSGDYVQGIGQLRSRTDKFCCLGVLCNLHAMAHPEIAAKQRDPETYLREGCYLPWQVQRWATLDEHAEVQLIDYNDIDHHTFEQIADAIEEQL